MLMLYVSNYSGRADIELAQLKLSEAGLEELSHLDKEKLTPAQMLAKVEILRRFHSDEEYSRQYHLNICLGSNYQQM